ncbi:MAG: hypothetical protein DRQ88_10160 [Epsilonproteobacteria bacterium]|nr:MAG: hypothetical protein DRQ89_08340 [Campylobacterota bacterium]RLA64891.1 MAG: hypothetical protein DRQ88_10160 [Campylobacterota bacterium]
MDDAKCLVDEEWFFYFQVSASLWKEKLAKFKGSQIIVPINWAFHQVDEHTFDFGQNRKEANLSQLVTLAESENKKIIFYLPLTPAPFLANGGVPDYLKSILSLNKEGMAHTCLDHEGKVNKLYSFFDQHIYRGFSYFVRNLGDYVRREKINSDFWGVNLGSLVEGKFNSYLEDYSPLFHRSFGGYIEVLKEQDRDYAINTPEEERVLIDKFHFFILDLYKKVAREGLGANWEGDFKVNLLGGNTIDFIKRSFNTDQINNYVDEMKEGVFQGLLPSTILLGKDSKSEIFNQQLNDILTQNYLPQRLNPPLNDDRSYNFSILSFFNIYNSTLNQENRWLSNGLLGFLNQKYKWAYNYYFNEYSYPDFGDENKVNFLPGEIIDLKIFQNMLRSFMEGGKFIIEKDKLDEEFARRLELFILENSIKVERLKFFSEIQNITLGEGRILLFEGSIFKALAENQKRVFWEKITNTFHLRHLDIDLPEDIDFFWSTRHVSTGEIKYREVRRLHLYNTGENKKNFKIKLRNNVSLIKKSNEDNGKIKTKQHYFEVEIGPSGSVGVDFGIWS